MNKIDDMITKCALIIFLFISIFFPNDIYAIKKISFILIIFINIKLILEEMLKPKNIIITFFGFLFPTVLICTSFFITNNLSLVISRGFAFYIIILVFIINRRNIDIGSKIIKILNIQVIFILALVILDMIGIMSINNSPIRDFIYKHDIGYIGKSINYPFYYKVFFKTSPLLIIALFNNFNKKNKSMFLATCIAILLTGARANVAFSFLTLLLYYINLNHKKISMLKLTIILIISTILSVTLFIFMPKIIDIFIIKGYESDLVRIGHIKGVLEVWEKNPITFITGTGLGSYFFSYSVGYANSIEIPYIDLIRQVGIINFSVYMIFIIYPIILKKTSSYKKYLYVGYLLIASTNPLLISSTGYLIYTYMYVGINNRKYKQYEKGEKRKNYGISEHSNGSI